MPKDIICSGPKSAELFLEKKDSRVILTGKFFLVVLLNCDRCLEEFDHRLESSFAVDFELRDQPETDDVESEYQCEKSEMDTIFLNKPEIDVNQVMMQQVLLSFPMKQLCTVNCLGLCAKCGANLNEEPNGCICVEENNSPFSVVAKLKK